MLYNFDEYLSTAEAAEYLGVDYGSFQALARLHNTPKYSRKLRGFFTSKMLYKKCDLDELIYILRTRSDIDADYMTLEEASETTGLSVYLIKQRMNRGEIRYVRQQNYTLILREDIKKIKYK
jgi:hypothetical protein